MKETRKIKKIIAFVFFMMAIIVSTSPPPITGLAATAPNNNLQVRYFNISGDCTFMIIKTGTKTISVLVDTGNGDGLLTKLKHPDIYDSLEYGTSTNNKDKKVIDYVFITHLHGDHTSGLINLLNSTDSTYKYIIRNLYYNTVVGTDDNKLSELKTAIKNSSGKLLNTYTVGTNYSTDGGGASRVAGDVTGIKTINIDGTQFTATLFPAKEKYESTNNNSMMIKFVYTPSSGSNKTNYVFSGDLFRGAIKKITNDTTNAYYTGLKSKDNDTTYLKLPHHASRRVGSAYVTNIDLPQQYFDGVTSNTVAANRFSLDQTYKYGNITLNKYHFYFDNGWVSDVKNYDEQFISIFRQGANSKVIGVGNVKTVADTASYFALIGLNEYHDTAPVNTISSILSKVTSTNLKNNAKIPEVKSAEKTYQVDVSYK